MMGGRPGLRIQAVDPAKLAPFADRGIRVITA
jgi:hypothetical protein